MFINIEKKKQVERQFIFEIKFNVVLPSFLCVTYEYHL